MIQRRVQKYTLVAEEYYSYMKTWKTSKGFTKKEKLLSLKYISYFLEMFKAYSLPWGTVYLIYDGRYILSWISNITEGISLMFKEISGMTNFCSHHMLKTQSNNFVTMNNWTGIATGYGLDGQGSIPSSHKWFLSTPKRPNLFWRPPSIISKKYRG
jgi:hypothetical protein